MASRTFLAGLLDISWDEQCIEVVLGRGRVQMTLRIDSEDDDGGDDGGEELDLPPRRAEERPPIN